MNNKVYEYSSILIEKKDFVIKLNISDKSEISFEQKKLFNALLNFGYVPTNEGNLKLTDRQLVDFWEYSKTSVLKDFSVQNYYALLNIAQLYDSQVPTIKETETFLSDSYQMTVAWINDSSTGKMATNPKAYKRDGLEIFNFEDDKLGSIYPEYFSFYEMVDEANNNWKSWNKTERYNFLEQIDNLSQKRKIILPNSLVQTLEYIRTNH